MSCWSVVGGRENGGIVARSGNDTKSQQLEPRLATHSLVREVELVGDRLHYQLISGVGPAEGWVSVRFKGKDLMLQIEADNNDDGENVVFAANGNAMGVIDCDDRIRSRCDQAKCSMYKLFPEDMMRPGMERTCARCGRFASEHLDRGSVNGEEEPDMVVSCRPANQFPKGSVLDLFHVAAPAACSVRTLRDLLTGKISEDTKITAEEGWGGLRELQDSDPLPEKVVLSERLSPVAIYEIITQSQARACQEKMMEILSTKKAQSKINELVEQGKDDDMTFRASLLKYLRSDVYPECAVLCELTPGGKTSVLLPQAIAAHATGDRDMIGNWLKLATLMQNFTEIMQAQGALDAMTN